MAICGTNTRTAPTPATTPSTRRWEYHASGMCVDRNAPVPVTAQSMASWKGTAAAKTHQNRRDMAVAKNTSPKKGWSAARSIRSLTERSDVFCPRISEDSTRASAVRKSARSSSSVTPSGRWGRGDSPTNRSSSTERRAGRPAPVRPSTDTTGRPRPAERRSGSSARPLARARSFMVRATTGWIPARRSCCTRTRWRVGWVASTVVSTTSGTSDVPGTSLETPTSVLTATRSSAVRATTDTIPGVSRTTTSARPLSRPTA